ncbi:G patch domain and ankyrin repeat-containing protein 1-like [Glandiceps talaboti]
MMSSSDHHNIRPVRFVRPTSNDSKDLASKIDAKNHNQRDNREFSLSGEEARSFYDSVIAEPSTASTNDLGRKVDRPDPEKAETRSPSGHRHHRRRAKRRSSSFTKSNCRTDERLINRFLRHAQCGDLNELVKCHERGCDINGSDIYSWTALMCAAHSGQLEIVRYLLLNGARKELCNNQGQTAADLANIAGHTDIVEMLLFEKKPDRKRKRKTKSKFWCDICKIEFSEVDREEHKHSTVHLFNSNHKVLPTQYGIPESNVGFQMMVKGGWDRDHGLGPEGTGQKYPVKTVLKRDREGLGASKDKNKAKVTHFKPNDEDAVKAAKKSKKEKYPCMRPGTISRKARERKARKEKEWERDLRIYFNS